MNFLKSALKIKLGMTNPYIIKPEYRLFSKQSNREQCRLIAKTKLNPDFHVMRFQLPLQNENEPKCLGIKIGQYIWVQLNDGTKRPYVPISSIDEPYYVDLLIRDMRAKNVGSFTQKLLDLPMGSPVMIQGPGTQFQYEGFGKFSYSDSVSNQKKQKKFKNIGIITHSSAITTSYSLIQSIIMNYDDRTGVSLLWLGDKQSDFVFINQFAEYAENYKLNMNVMLTMFQKGWLGPYGKVNQSQILDFMPPPNSNEIIIMSGLEGELSYLPELIKKIGYKDYLNF